jgi:hypothetical protein
MDEPRTGDRLSQEQAKMLQSDLKQIEAEIAKTSAEKK